MDWKEKIEDAMDRLTGSAKRFFVDLIEADDRPPNWKVYGEEVKEKRWRYVGEENGRQ